MCPAQAAAKSNETAGASVTQNQNVQLSFPESAHDSGGGSACCRLGRAPGQSTASCQRLLFLDLPRFPDRGVTDSIIGRKLASVRR